MSYKILIIGSNSSENGIQNRKSGRLLMKALEKNKLKWEVHYPTEGAIPDLQAYDAILFWSHIVHNLPEYLEHAQRVEEEARKKNIPVINSIANAHSPHSYFLQKWQANGINCAKHCRFQNFEEIDLDYPIIIRRDGVHQGKDVFLIQNPMQAKKLIEERQKDSTQKNFDLAIEYVDTKWEDGYYRKFRSYIIGNQVIPRHMHTSEQWLVNLEHSVVSEESMKQVQHFFFNGDRNPSKVLAASKATGHEIVALDYSIDADGKHIFWEANRHFLMDGDVSKRSSELFLQVTGLSAEDIRQNDEKVVQAFYELIVNRIQGI